MKDYLIYTGLAILLAAGAASIGCALVLIFGALIYGTLNRIRRILEEMKP